MMPISARIERKPIYWGRLASARVRHIPEYCHELGITQSRLADYAGVSDTTIYNASRGIYRPSLGLYLELGMLLGWNLSRDLNHIYAYKTVAPDELYSRLSYVFPSKLGFRRDLRFRLMKYTGYSTFEIGEALRYSPRVRIEVFAGCLRAVRDLEKKHHVKRFLEVED